ncbi:MAG: hypothetical protein JWP17_1013 [Solirubrobacterales bacterium]|jgi:hypothetical protein|nr:hypothetical protein [Solirubrobacterales bacterium]
MVGNTIWYANVLMVIALALMLFSRSQKGPRAVYTDRELADIAARADAIFARFAGRGSGLVESPPGRWTALVSSRQDGPKIPLALHAPPGRPDLALASALRLLAIEAPREVTDVDEIYEEWCVHHNGIEWNVHIPCRRCGHTRVPLPYNDPFLVDVARLAARELHKEHGEHRSCPQCVVVVAA